ASAGKSAIMQTLCQRLQEADRQGGSFFFKQGRIACRNAKVLFATLAYELALHNPNLKPPISWSVEADPSVVGRDLDVQLQKLIIQLCQLLTDAAPPVLLTDGLDECEGLNIQQKVLWLLQNAACNNPCHLRILVTSHPEPHIRETFESFSDLIDLSMSNNLLWMCRDTLVMNLPAFIVNTRKL
ncbi:hypothetical protein C8R44DRAFT_645433, partial [Mycena epipterygia]